MNILHLTSSKGGQGRAVGGEDDDGGDAAVGDVVPRSLLFGLQKMLYAHASMPPANDDLLWLLFKALLIRDTTTPTLCEAMLNCITYSCRLVPFLKQAITDEVAATLGPAQLFRGVSSVTRVFAQYYKSGAGLPYVKHCLQPLFSQLPKSALEIDPARLSGAEADISTMVTGNAARIMQITQQLFDHIVASVEVCPMSLRMLVSHARAEVARKFPEKAVMIVGGFVFLRCLCPAIVSPEAYGLITSPVSAEAQRSLILISKLLQLLANGITDTAAEPTMTPVAPFLTNNLFACKQFYLDLTQNLPAQPEKQAAIDVVSLFYDQMNSDLTTILKNISIHMPQLGDALKDNQELLQELKDLVTAAKSSKVKPLLFGTSKRTYEDLKKEALQSFDDLFTSLKLSLDAEIQLRMRIELENVKLQQELRHQRDSKAKLKAQLKQATAELDVVKRRRPAGTQASAKTNGADDWVDCSKLSLAEADLSLLSPVQSPGIPSSPSPNPIMRSPSPTPASLSLSPSQQGAPTSPATAAASATAAALLEGQCKEMNAELSSNIFTALDTVTTPLATLDDIELLIFLAKVVREVKKAVHLPLPEAFEPTAALVVRGQLNTDAIQDQKPVLRYRKKNIFTAFLLLATQVGH
eukprot:TRINITY_DN1185_c0_g1_i4.p1 TRINITY_DN1185_c0_g1~~TRINITY_DN1185_c0_g1_i4.p1  ORF type:complete len:657 (+),score=186.42 TRINITY_DN1185_c0_g1_i4:60-1973(+)